VLAPIAQSAEVIHAMNKPAPGIRSVLRLPQWLLALLAIARAGAAWGCEDATFACVVPEFTRAASDPAYASQEAVTSPAHYDAAAGDFRARFSSPSGKTVTIVVKAPVTKLVYDVPPIRSGQSVAAYLNGALVDANGHPRNATVINLPNATYDFDFPPYTNCTPPGGQQPTYVHWQVANASDMVIDGHGATVNFSDFCLGLNLAQVHRLTLRNINFAWPHVRIASLAKVTAVGGNGSTGYTYDLRIDSLPAAPRPRMIAAATAWDAMAGHWDLRSPNDDVSYGDGINDGVPLICSEGPESDTATACTVRNVPSYGVRFTVGETLLLRHYSFATAISLSGDDITLDHVGLQNLIGSDFTYTQGRGLHVDALTLARARGQPVSAVGGGSLITNVSGDIVIENSTIGYQSDDALDINTTISRYTPAIVADNTPMNTFTFDVTTPTRLPWPPYNLARTGDRIGIFDNQLRFRGAATVLVASYAPDGSSATLSLDRPIEADLARAGFIAGDLGTSAGARYLVRNNRFEFNRARALLLQTPYGLVWGNTFVGQTLKQVYMLASQYWGEGAGAQEVVIGNNLFDAAGHDYLSGFFALDLMAEAANFPNFQDEVAGTTSAAPPINQDVLVVGNTFLTDRPQALVNVSSASNVVFARNRIVLGAHRIRSDSAAGSDAAIPAPRQYPFAIHDASHIDFVRNLTYASHVPDLGCEGSIMTYLASPAPLVSAFSPVACDIAATSSALHFRGLSDSGASMTAP
jgi:hypothetical protein